MKKLIILLVTWIVSLCSYSQDTAKLSYKDSTIKKEIAYYLTEGLECKEILIQKNNQIKNKDSVISIYKRMNRLQAKKDSLQNKQFKELQEDYEICNKEYNRIGKQNIKLNNTNKILIGTNSITLLLLLILLL